MKLLDLYNLRENFWRLNKGATVAFKQLMNDPGDGSTLTKQPDSVLVDMQTFLRMLLKTAETTPNPEPSLIADIKLRLDLLAKKLNTPFANL